MAKGNPLMGQLRGSVGDVVFSRLGGQQVSRGRNRQPKNPQSLTQMYQRAKLASLVEFFAHGKQALFKFAFESKKASESDYNAFVRYNMNRIAPNSKVGVKNGNPIVGNYMLTQGSLTPMEVLFDTTNVNPKLVVGATPSSATAATLTVGQLSASMKAQYGLEEGDIITFVQLSSDNTPEATVAEAIADGTYALGKAVTQWNIQQFRINSASTELVSSLGIFYLTSYTGGASVLEIGNHTATSFATTSYCYGVCVIVSRVTKNGVKVSNSYVHNNQAVEAIIAYAQSEVWQEFVAQSWKAKTETELAPDAILKGSLSVQ